MKKILFTTAYSNSSKNTWQFVLRLAQHFGAQITLMHVYEDASVSFVLGNLDEKMVENLENFNASKFEEEKNRLHKFAVENTPKQDYALSVKYIVATGNIASAILQEEQENNYDLIVLGTTTSSSFSDTLFGSVSQKILAQATTPVFLVPPMAAYHGIKKIVYATNFEQGDLMAIQHLMEWIQAFDAKLHLLHVDRKTYGGTQAAERMENLIRIFKESSGADSLSYQLLEGNITKSIEEYLKMTGSDMIALTTHKRGFFAQLFDISVTNQIATESMVPVLIYKQG
jgi:nucleotide-binding universal stress UspA family protein